jgi:hypothetical protein
MIPTGIPVLLSSILLPFLPTKIEGEKCGEDFGSELLIASRN